MRRIYTFLVLGLLVFAGCKNSSTSLRSIDPQKWKADSLAQINSRIAFDFPLTEELVTEQIQKRLGDKFSKEKMKEWEENGWLEYRLIDGEKRYFNRAASNLALLSKFHLNRQERDSAIASDKVMISRKSHTQSIIKASEKHSIPVMPVGMKITYTLTVNADAVPDGETVRCWLPYPREKQQRQKDIYLLGVSNEDFTLSPDSCVHRTIYMENKAEKGKPVVFMISYSYTSSGQYFDPSSMKILPYDTRSALYKRYTAEQLPQICFTENIKRLADSITGNEKDPREIVRKIYYWFNENIPWAGALEYSIIPNIPEYVIKNRKGDCGMQTFLFMSMLRYKGIPVNWQSGWMMPPDAKNLHDWCEVYYEDVGWVPADISFNLQYSNDLKTREFYITGIDSYRLIINDGISGDLYPAKKFLRSEPFDFQRGEVEWNGGNLYFDQWDYHMDIEYLPPIPPTGGLTPGN
jgi:transglutaminase-like putative cysteine protease